MEALRKNNLGDIDELLSHYDKKTSSNYGSPLHLALVLSHVSTVRHILSMDSPWLTVQNSPDMETPLHLAVKVNQYELVELLLSHSSVNETIKNANGKMAEEICQSKKILELIQGNYSLFDV